MILIKNGKIFTENGIVNEGYLIIKDKLIYKIGHGMAPDNDYEFILDAENHPIIPGFIDLQVNGAGGNLIMDADVKKTQVIADIHGKHGVTGFLGTTVAWTDEEQCNALISGAHFMELQNHGARMLGLHMEGPFLNPVKAGAHYKEYLHNPSIDLLNKFITLSKNKIKLITMAAELNGSKEFIKKAKENNITISLGHSNATYDESINSFDNGVSMVTHVFNAMNGINSREPGLIVGLITSKTAFASIICDGIHVHSANLNLLKREIGIERLILVTDCAPITGTEQKVWIQNGMKVFIKDYTGFREDGTIAGSVLTMNKAAKMAKKLLNCTTEDVIKMSSYNPAKIINIIDKRGSIKEGKYADLVVLKDDIEFDPQYVFIEGQLEFRE